jgi:hypothetical protein
MYTSYANHASLSFIYPAIMSFASESRTQSVPVKLKDGTVVYIEATSTGREDVAFNLKSFGQVTEALEGISRSLVQSLEKVEPDKASVKFGLELAIESGNLTAVIVKGSGKANLEITLEWNKYYSNS